MTAMADVREWVHRIEPPLDFYSGVQQASLCMVDNILFFKRTEKQDLQQKTFENRPHHRFVMIFNLETRGAVSIDSFAFRLDPGEALLIAPYQFHHYLNLQAERLCWLFLTFETTTPERLVPLRNRPMAIDTFGQSILARMLTTYTATARNRGWRNNELILETALLINQMIARAAQSPMVAFSQDRSHGGRSARLLEAINLYLGKHLEEGVSIDELARHVGLSDSQLRKQFKQEFGVSLGSYIRHFQMSKAVSLVRNSEMTFSQVAFECGFQSLESFSRAFKRMMGESARSYRKKG